MNFKRLFMTALLVTIMGSLMASAALPDPYKMLQGQQPIPQGGPWTKDNALTYFGTDKDASIAWSSTYSRLQISGTLGPVTQDSAILTTNTTLSATSCKSFYWLSATTSKGLNISLPLAATMNNRTIEFAVRTANTGSCTTLLNGYGAETINNAATKAATAKYATIELKSSGTEWYITKSVGTWS